MFKAKKDDPRSFSALSVEPLNGTFPEEKFPQYYQKLSVLSLLSR